MSEMIEWCIDHNVPMESCTICRLNTCPVSIYSRGQRIIVGEATFTEEDGEHIASIKLHQHMPNFLEAFREGIVTGLSITPERAALQDLMYTQVDKTVIEHDPDDTEYYKEI